MKKLYVLFIGITLIFTSCKNDKVIKTVYQLTEDEKAGLNTLVEQIYEDAGIKFFYETTYLFVPLENGSMGKKLDTPITLLSGASIGSLALEEKTLILIKEGMKNKMVNWKGSGNKKYCLSICNGYLVKDPGGAGGSMYESNDMVTIMPTEIEIDEK